MSADVLSYIYRARQHDTGVDVLQEMRTVELPKNFRTIQQALLEVRVVLEEVNTVARSDKVYGRGDVAAALVKLAATAGAMASALRARDEHEVIRAIDVQQPRLGLNDREEDEAAQTKARKRKRRAKAACAA